jgi:RNA recognition motif-containing protein
LELRKYSSSEKPNNRVSSSEESSGHVPIVIQGQKLQRQDVRVREIWLGNMQENTSKSIIYSHFFICGEIDEIEVYK